MTTSPHPEPGATGIATPATRRVFITSKEAPGLFVGAWRGEPVALRRIVGARRTGRIGILLCALALAAAAPPALWPAALACHALVSALTWRLFARPAGVGSRAHQRLLLWLLAPAWAIAALPRVLLGSSWVWPVIAILIAQAVLCRHLTQNEPFGRTASSPASSDTARASAR